MIRRHFAGIDSVDAQTIEVLEKVPRREKQVDALLHRGNVPIERLHLFQMHAPVVFGGDCIELFVLLFEGVHRFRLPSMKGILGVLIGLSGNELTILCGQKSIVELLLHISTGPFLDSEFRHVL